MLRLMSNTMLRRLEINSICQFIVAEDFLELKLIFQKLSIEINWQLEIVCKLRSNVADIKHKIQSANFFED